MLSQHVGPFAPVTDNLSRETALNSTTDNNKNNASNYEEENKPKDTKPQNINH